MLRIASALVLAFSLATAGTGQENQIIIADIDASWCTSCAAGERAATEVAALVPGVRSVRLDVSTPTARADSAREARALGIARVFEAHRFAPGAYAIATHLQPMQVIPLDGKRSPAELAALVAQAAQEPPTPVEEFHHGS